MASFAVTSSNLHADGDGAITPAQDERWIATEGTPGLVSVIIPTYNRSALIGEALGSVVAQLYRPIEIVVVDDGSTDDTGQAINRFAETLAGHEGVSLNYIYQDNAGAPAARNRGTRAALGEFLQYLDSDDLLDSRKIELQVAVLRAASEADFAYGPIRELENPTRTIYCQREMSWERMLRKSVVTPAMQTAGPLSRRAMIAELGPWNEAIAPMEDWEYYSRAVVAGQQGAYSPDAVTLHRMDIADRLRWTGKPGTVDKFITGRVAQLESMLSHACGAARQLKGFYDLVAWNMLFVGAFALANAWTGDERRLYARAGEVPSGALARAAARSALFLSRRVSRKLTAALLSGGRWVYYRTIYKLPGHNT